MLIINDNFICYKRTDMIDENYNTKINTVSDIYEHLPTLYEYSKECTSIAEFGVRSIVSTWAFLKALKENKRPNKKLICLDIESVPLIHTIIPEARKYNIDMQFICNNSIHASIPSIDLLFIDTWHVYGHLKRELAMHHEKVKKYIIMHDTEVDKIAGESIRMGMNIQSQSQLSGYPIEEITHGLQPAIDEFLTLHQEWTIHKVYTNNNGLTILKRK
jgi:hypothetical protein